MNCKTVKPLLSEFMDERLDAASAWQIQTHLSECADCKSLHQEMEAIRLALQTLPTRQPSSNFDAALTQRLALTRRPQKRQTWRDRAALLFPRPTLLLRPALALGAAVAVGGGLVLLPVRAPQPDTRSAARTADHAFVADCVAQRNRDAAGEPLADVAAQNLTDRLDPASPGDAAAPESSTGPF